jgi:putative ABC transport system permease protein
MSPHRSFGARELGVILRFFFARELRAHPFFFLLLFVTLFLGTFGLMGISLVSEQVQSKLASNAKELLSSDIAIGARRPVTDEEAKKIQSLVPSSTSYQVTDLYSMVTHLQSTQARLVEVRVVEKGFPFYGKLELKTGAWDPSQFQISKDLADLWNIQVGDDVQIGDLKLKVSGIVVKDSSAGMRGFSLAPRVYLPFDRLAETNLVKLGVTGSFSYHFKLPGMSDVQKTEIKRSIYKELKDPAIRVTLPQDSSEQTGRVMNIIRNFMALSALIGLVLALVGVFYLYQSQLQARLKDLCLLNLYGLSKFNILVSILAQFSAVYFISFIVQVSLLVPAYKTFHVSLSDALGVELSPELNRSSILLLLPFLYGLSLTILVPLLLGLMRTPMGLQLKASKLSLGRFRAWDFIPFAASLWAFSMFLAESKKIGSLFFGSLILVFILSTLFVRLGQWIIGRFVKGKGLRTPILELGLALRGLTRSGHKLTLSFLSLAMGATLISLILQLDSLIGKEFAWDDNKPGLFIFDIQDEQIDDLRTFSQSMGTPIEAVTPMIRGRLEMVNGKKFVREKYSNSMGRADEDEDNRTRNSGLNLTYRQEVTDAEKIVEGKSFPQEVPEGPTLVSLEKRWAQRMNIELGDQVQFDIQGVPFDGVVYNIRDVKWTTFYPNFFVSVQPGAIEAAPKTYLAVLPTGGKDKRLAFQRGAVEKFPNISFIDVEELVGKLGMLFKKSRAAIELISMLSLGVGLIILYGLSHDQVYRRRYDLALMKSLGFSSDFLLRNLVIEFGLLFFAAMSVGFSLGWGIAQVIGREAFKLPLGIDWTRLFVPALALSALCLLTILVASYRATRTPARELLADA